MGFDVMDELYLPNQFMVLRVVFLCLSLDGAMGRHVVGWLGAVRERVVGDPFAALHVLVLASPVGWVDVAPGWVATELAVPSRVAGVVR